MSFSVAWSSTQRIDHNADQAFSIIGLLVKFVTCVFAVTPKQKNWNWHETFRQFPKCDKNLLQNASGFSLRNAIALTQFVTDITNCDVYYKMRPETVKSCKGNRIHKIVVCLLGGSNISNLRFLWKKLVDFTQTERSVEYFLHSCFIYLFYFKYDIIRYNICNRKKQFITFGFDCSY